MRAVIALVVLVLYTAPARADEPGIAVSVAAGGASSYDDEGSLGSGWAVGAGVERVLFGSTRFEAAVDAANHHREGGYFQLHGTTVVGSGALVQRFGRRAAQPYVFGGLDIGHHAGTNQFPGATAHPSSTDLGFRIGSGVAIRAGARLELRPEFRWDSFFVDDDADPATVPSVVVRLAWRL